MAKLTNTTIYGSANITGSFVMTGNTFDISANGGINISNANSISSVVITNTGAGYQSIPSVVFSNTTTGGATANANAVMRFTFSPYTAGNVGVGYANGDFLYANVSGSLSNAVFQVTSNTATTYGTGGINAITLINAGLFFSLPNYYNSSGVANTGAPAYIQITGNTSVSGTGANIALGSNGLIVNNVYFQSTGSGYVEQPTVTFTGGSPSTTATGYTYLNNTTQNIKIPGQTTSFYQGIQTNPAFQITDGGSTGGYWQASNGSSGGQFFSVNTPSGSAYIGTGSGTAGITFRTNFNFNQFGITHTPSSVNYLQVTGAVTGGTPALSSTGTDANVALSISTKGFAPIYIGQPASSTTQQIQLSPGGGSSLFVTGSQTNVNYIAIKGAATGSSPQILSRPGDANVGLIFGAYGNGNLDFYASGDPNAGTGILQFRIAPTSYGVNSLQVTGNTTTNGPVLSSTGSDGNVDINITTKGTGNINHYAANSSFSGNVTINGALVVAGGLGVGGDINASNGTFTTITGQTEVLKGTGQNLFLYSNTFSNSYWRPASGLGIPTNSVTDPFGGSTAWAIAYTAQYQSLYPTTNFISGVTYTISYWLQSTSGTKNFILFGATSSTNYGTVTATTTWTRYSTTFTMVSTEALYVLQDRNASGFQTINIYGAQLEIGSVTNTYIPTTTTAVYGTPTLSFSGVAGLGLQSDGSLYVSPAGTGALQAQATTSTATGGNARGANAVDWQTLRAAATQVAFGTYSTVSGGNNNAALTQGSTVGGGYNNYASGSNYNTIAGGYSNTISGSPTYGFIGGGQSNSVNGVWASSVGGNTNTAAGYYNFIGGGFTNSGNASSAVTTQATTIAVTAGTTFYLSAINANIKVGQYITGTGVSGGTYATSTVTTGTAAVMNTSTISGTTLTVGSLASGTIIAGMVLTGTGVTAGTYIVSGSGSSWVVSASQTVTSTTITGTAYTFTISQAATTAAGVTLSFYTPHGVVVGGGNNQATGSYSFIGGGGDAGTASNRNVASGDWSVVCGGIAGQATGLASFVGGGGIYSSTTIGNVSPNIASGSGSVVTGGYANQSNGSGSVVGGGDTNIANSNNSVIVGGRRGTTRGIVGYFAFPACAVPVSTTQGLSQAALLILGRQTTDATATVLTSDVNAAGTTNQVILPNNSAYYFKGSVIANVTGAANGAAWSFEGAIMRGANAGSTVLIGTPMLNRVAVSSGASAWSIAITADTTNGGLAITVTGVAATTIRWVAKIETTEVTY